MAKRDPERRRSDDERAAGPEDDAPTPPGAAPGGDGEEGEPEEVAIAAVDLVAALARLGLEAALAYDVAALSYEWDRESEAMLKRFQDEEERHLAWLSAKHDALGGHADPEGPDAPSP